MPSSLLHKTVGNAVWLTVGAALETVLQLLFLVIAGRELGPEEFGFYGYLLSILTMILAVAHFGLPVVAVREFAQHPEHEGRLFAATFRIRGLLAILFFAAAVVTSLVVPQSAAHRVAVWAMFVYLLFIPFDVSPLFDARKLSRWDVPGKVAGRAAALLTLVLLWKVTGELTVLDAAIASSLLMLVNVSIGWQVARRRGLELRPLARTDEVPRLVRASLPIMWSNLATIAYTQSQTVLTKWLSTSLETGYYALASRLLMPLLMLKGVLYRLLLPIFSDAAHDRATLTTTLERAMPVLALIFMPLAALAIPAAEVLMVPVFGAEYVGAIRPFQLSVSYLFFTGLSSMCGTALLAAGDARTPTVGLTIGCATSLGLSLLLIPQYGAVGAAWSAWIAEIVSNLYTLPKFLQLARPRVLKRLLAIGASSLGGTLVYYLLTIAAGVWPFVALILAAALIGAGLWVTGEISPKQLRAVAEMVRRKNA